MPSYQNAYDCKDMLITRGESDRQSIMRRELEAYLAERCEQELAENSMWDLDFASMDAYESSCDGYRERWSQVVGEFQFSAPFNARYEPFFEDDKVLGQWLWIELDHGLYARAALAMPKERSGKLPLVIAQHGIGSSPERVFGFGDGKCIYHAYGRALLDAGYAVLAPSNITERAPRGRLQRLCMLLGKTLAGQEVGKIRRLLDYAVTLPEIDAERVGMWGISLGGMYTLFAAPLDRRIKASIICAWFNDRLAKMAHSSRLYSSFLDADEEHIWLPGWLSGGFDDSELLAMVCPRAAQIQQGRSDGIGWWPLQHETYETACHYYRRLGIEDRLEYVDHHGGHEITVAEGIEFFARHLQG